MDLSTFYRDKEKFSVRTNVMSNDNDRICAPRSTTKICFRGYVNNLYTFLTLTNVKFINYRQKK